MIPSHNTRFSDNPQSPTFPQNFNSDHFEEIPSMTKRSEKKNKKNKPRMSYNYDYKVVIDGSAGNFLDEK